MSSGLMASGAFAGDLLPGYLLDRWGTADGLPVEAISAVVAGKDGYVWLSTFGGLVRFDGDRFVTFDSSTDEHLASDRLISLASGSDGLLWAVDEMRRLGQLRRPPLPHVRRGGRLAGGPD